MADINFTIPDGKIAKVVDAMKGLYQIPTIDDPQNPGQNIPQFTDNAWAKEVVRKFIVQQVARWEQVKAQRAIQFTPDDTIVV